MRQLLLDGNHLASRCRHAQASLRTSKGCRSGVVYGTLQGISFVRNTLKMELGQVWVVWDGGRAQNRLKLYPDYKKRKPKVYDTPEQEKEDQSEFTSYIFQLEELRIALEHAGVRSIRVDGCEADDLIAILAHELTLAGDQATVYTGDRDFHQLCEFADIFDPKDELLERKNVYEKHGVEHGEDILLLKALQGDPSDNIPGVPGIGPVKAALALPWVKPLFLNLAPENLAREFARSAEEKKVAAAVDKILSHEDVVGRNLKLMRLPQSWDHFPHYDEKQGTEFLAQIEHRPKANQIKFAQFLKQWELESILDKLERW